MSEHRDLPTLTDGTVSLRPWREEDIEASVAGHDAEIAHWAGLSGPPTVADRRRLVAEWQAARNRGEAVAAFVIEHDDEPVGNVEVTPAGPGTGLLSWALYAGQRGKGYAARAVRILADWATTETGQGGLGLVRVEATVEPDNRPSLRVATRAGLRQEGVRRVEPGSGDRPETTEYVVLARLVSDPPLTEPGSFRALLNSFLPRKRAISQLMVRDPDDNVLMCQLTYKRDWDLPGGVVEVGESPLVAVGREITEELGLVIEPGRLLLTDWLPAWGGWDDAVCLVYDGGRHSPGLLDGLVRQEREIVGARFCTPEEVRRHAADFTARRVEAALASLRGEGPAYTESGVG